MNYLLVEDKIPAGAEVILVSDGNYTHAEMMSDRAAFYFDHLPKGKHVVTYSYRAQIPGTYTIPPAHAELMYSPDITAETEPSWVRITR